MKKTIDASKLHYRDLNEKVRKLIDEGCDHILLKNVCGQRFIGTALQQDVKMEITGVCGNDLSAFMGKGEIIVRGDVQDGCGNTMSGGKIAVHGNAGDIVGHSMRGGEIYVKGNVGYRVGIHMKEYKEFFPVICVGGSAGAFLGEYQAGGLIILLGLERELFSDPFYIGTGMHGGKIFLRGDIEPGLMGRECKIEKLNENDEKLLKKYVKNFAVMFGIKEEKILDGTFNKIEPFTHRPYGRIYAY